LNRPCNTCHANGREAVIGAGSWGVDLKCAICSQRTDGINFCMGGICTELCCRNQCQGADSHQLWMSLKQLIRAHPLMELSLGSIRVPNRERASVYGDILLTLNGQLQRRGNLYRGGDRCLTRSLPIVPTDRPRTEGGGGGADGYGQCCRDQPDLSSKNHWIRLFGMGADARIQRYPPGPRSRDLVSVGPSHASGRRWRTGEDETCDDRVARSLLWQLPRRYFSICSRHIEIGRICGATRLHRHRKMFT